MDKLPFINWRQIIIEQMMHHSIGKISSKDFPNLRILNDESNRSAGFVGAILQALL